MFYRGEKIEDSPVVLEAVKSMSATTAPEPTAEERIAALETATDDMILLMAELIGGN